eukprot:SAG11_NODE_24533_length_372_cov_0.556777_1_plen_64_part_10
MNDFLNQVALSEGNMLFANIRHLFSDVSKLDLKVKGCLSSFGSFLQLLFSSAPAGVCSIGSANM